jgi:hypothetical protein
VVVGQGGSGSSTTLSLIQIVKFDFGCVVTPPQRQFGSLWLDVEGPANWNSDKAKNVEFIKVRAPFEHHMMENW